MSFIVSARKYRPKTFDEVVGQQAVTNVLKKSIEQKRLPQALLFTGPRGVGKTSCARIMAREVNKEFLDNPEQDMSFNIFELDAASNNSVDDIRELIEQVRIPPQIARYKVYIIDEVHMLSNQAFNAFLKTLEEPPAHAIFILATTEKHKIPATILSRCQIFDFKRISITDIKNHLKKIADLENIEADEDALYLIARKADGALRDALSAFDKIVSLGGKKITRNLVSEHLGLLDFDVYFEITDLILSGDTQGTIKFFNNLINKGVDIHYFISGLASHFRDLLIARQPVTIELLEQSKEIKNKYREQSVSLDNNLLMQTIDLLVQADLNYKISQNPELLTELTLLKILNLLSGSKKKNLNDSGNQFVKLPSALNHETAEKTVSVDKTKTVKPSDSIPEKTNNQPEVKTVEKTEVKEEIQHENSFLGLSALKKIKEAPPKEKLQEDFNADTFQKYWDEYIESLLLNGEKRHAALLQSCQAKPAGNKIEVQFDNNLSVREFNHISGKLLSFLQNKLRNHFIEFEIKMVERKENENPSVKFYTKEERLRRLIELNPNIKELVKKWQLE